MNDARKKSGDGTEKSPTSRSRKRSTAPKSTVIYVKISDRDEQIELFENTTDDEVIRLFEAAAELTAGNVLHLMSSAALDPTHQQRLMVDRNIPPNTPDTRYTLVIGLASLRSQMAVSKLGRDVLKLEERIESVEKLARILSVGSKCATDFDNSDVGTFDVVNDLCLKTRKIVDCVLSRPHLRWLGFALPLLNGAKRVNGSKEPRGLVEWDVGCPPREVHDARCHQVNAKFRLLKGVVPSNDVIKDLRTTTFDNWQWRDHELMALIRIMFMDLELHTTFKIELPVFDEWLCAVYCHYSDVPYHSFKHCFMVTQMVFALIHQLDLRSILNDLDLLTLLTAAVCHDVNHPGLNNTFQINARTTLGTRYNDLAPLENHHSAVTFQILSNPDTNPFRNMAKEQFREFREAVMVCILATEMSRHKEFIQSLRTFAPVFDIYEKDHKELLLCVLMKASDVSNEVRPFDVTKKWIDCLSNEFEAQYNNEIAANIPPTPYMDMTRLSRASVQIGFIKFVLVPLYEAVAEMFPVARTLLLDPIEKSLDYWLAEEKRLSTIPEIGEDDLDFFAKSVADDLNPSFVSIRMDKY